MKYRKKPVVIDAIVWTGENIKEVKEFCGTNCRIHYSYTEFENAPQVHLVLCTLEGEMTARPGTYIVKGLKGEVYPCRKDIFEMTYEPVE